jgi:hypothetical protein
MNPEKAKATVLQREINSAYDLDKWSLEAECGTLGSMILAPDIIPQVLEILPDETAFYLPEHQKIVSAIVELYKAGNPVDGLTVRTALKAKNQLDEIGGVKYLQKILDSVPSAANAFYYAKVVRDKKVERDVYVAAEKIRDVTKETGTVVEKINSIIKISQSLERIKTDSDLLETKIDVSQIRPLTGSELVQVLGLTIKNDEQNKLTTFLCQLSAYTSNSQFNISFSAPSSTGKSYIPLETAGLFPARDVIAIGYCSPTAFFHDVGEWDANSRTYIVDLSRKILIFLDQPHTLLLQHLRPMLSHDKREISLKITDKTQKLGLKTKNVLLKGFPSVIFCTAGLKIDEQEATRFLLLSPETNQEKIRAAVYEKLKRETDPDGYQQWLEGNPQRQDLKRRIIAIKRENIEEILIGTPEKVKEIFLQDNRVLKPRHSRDIGRLISLIKCSALLNCWFRERRGANIITCDEDVEQGFALWNSISQAQEIGLPPYLYQLYQEIILPAFNEKNAGRTADNFIGLTRQEIMHKHRAVYGRHLSDEQLRREILPMLVSAGLIIQESDQLDKRRILIYPTTQPPISSDKAMDFYAENEGVKEKQ